MTQRIQRTTRQIPGTVDVSECNSVDEALVRAGMDYRVEGRPMSTLGRNFAPVDVPGYVAMVRDKDGRVLDVNGTNYGVIQPDEAFAPFRKLGELGARLTSLGEYDGGRKIHGTAKLPLSISPRVGDLVDLEVWVRASFDGSSHHEIGGRLKRLACLNGMTMSLGVDKFLKLRHTSNVTTKLGNVEDFITRAFESFHEFEQVALALAARRMTLAEVQKMAETLIPDPVGAKATKAENKRGAILDLFSNGTDTHGLTAWDALNAVTEYTNWLAPTRSGDANRWASAQWGQGAVLNDEAYQYLHATL